MFHWLRRLFAKPPAPTANAVTVLDPDARPGFFSTDVGTWNDTTAVERLTNALRRSFSVTAKDFRRVGADGVAMDSAEDAISSAKGAWAVARGTVPDGVLEWYASQGFIGFQLCAIMAQHWLVAKACYVPARDAMRKGYKVTRNDGKPLSPEVADQIRLADRRLGIKRQTVEFVKMGRVFGIRIAMFNVESTDPKYYEYPFNPDGVTPGSYKGITQIDPYWCAPELSGRAASDPTAPDFYEPTWWVINGKRIHKSHLVIMRGDEVSDVLKPSYQYAGVSVPQRLYERVYAADRTANEAPQLAMTKRAVIFYTDTKAALADQPAFETALAVWRRFLDNFGVKVADKEADKIEQQDTSLADLDAVIMTQYQLVAAAANMPATKLLQTTIKGFNATGEYEESNYHEELENIQTSDMEPLLNRHHLLLIRSEISPGDPFETTVQWEPLDSPTAAEAATTNKTKAETALILTQVGAIDGMDERERLTSDVSSGYTGLPTIAAPIKPAAPGATATDSMDVVGAGIIYHTNDGQVLMLQRADTGEWCFPGGHVEDQETAEQAAMRESVEEVGHSPLGVLEYFNRKVMDGVDFTTFYNRIPAPFTPVLNDESTGYAWITVTSIPTPLLPGCIPDLRLLFGYGF